MAAITADLYGTRAPAQPTLPQSVGPRRVASGVAEAGQVAPVAGVRNTSPLMDLSILNSVTPIFPANSAVPNREPPANVAPPTAANSYLGTPENMAVDDYYRGIKLDSDPARVVTMTPDYMDRMRRVIDRSEIDPYTGKKIDFYKELPPEENKDYRLPRETMDHVNRRLIAIQGYDHTKPKAKRTERLADAPQPDGSYGDASTYMRRMGEMRERIERDMVNNKNGERPTWLRETQRAFGYSGYQDMARYVPDMPATTRADMHNIMSAGDQVNNPDPTNELKVRGAYRTDAKTPHTGKVDYRTHGKVVDADKPRYQDGTDQRYLEKPTHRGTQDDQGFQPGPQGLLVSAEPRFGESHVPRRLEMPAGITLRNSHQLTGVGATSSDAAANRVFQRIMDGVGRQNAAQTGPVMMGMAGAQAMAMSLPTTISTNSDLVETLREQHMVPELRGMAESATLPAQRDHQRDAVANNRPDMLAGPMQGLAQGNMYHTTAATNVNTSTDRGFNSKRTLEQPGVVPMHMAPQEAQFQEGYTISTKTDHEATKRAQVQYKYGDYYVPQDSLLQAGVPRDQQHMQSPHKSEAYRQNAGAMRNAAAAPSLGGLQIGEQQILSSSGKRAQTGNVSATSYLHGGGEGAGFYDKSIFNRESFEPQKNNDRTFTRDFRAIQQMAAGRNEGM